MNDTSRTVASEELRAVAGPRFQAVFEASPDACCIVVDGEVVKANAAAASLLGVESARALEGERLARQVTPERRRVFSAVLARAAAGGAVRPFEARWWRPDGSSFEAECTFASVLWAGDEAVQLCLRDISRRRETEEALREENRRKDTFLAVVAHELRNPLAPLRAGLDVARLSPERDPRTADALAIMDRQLTHLSTLVDDLLDVTRIRNGRLAIARLPIELGQVIEASVETTRHAYQERDHTLDVVVSPPASHRVRGDFDRLVQVFTNLLLNAAKYTPSGGHVAVHIARAGNTETVTVIDNGAGIAEADLKRLFKPFERLGQCEECAAPGMGIGLAVTRQLVDLHGGHVAAESEGPGRGSVFRVTLPRLAEEREVRQPAVETPAPSTSTSRRVLVADDDEDVVAALALLLETLGHEVFTARDGTEAIATALAVRPDLILLDLEMPEIGGVEVARRLRATVGGEDMRIGALTGRCQPADRERTQEAGFNWHLLKPVTAAELEEILARLPARG